MAAETLHTTRYFDDSSASAPPARRSTWVDRVFDAIYRARQAAAEREVALLIERGGFKMTDNMERRIVDHFV